MAVTHDPVFAQGYRRVTGITTDAKTTLGDTTNAVKLFTAGADGSHVKRLRVRPRGTVTTVTKLMLFRVTTGGTAITLADSVEMNTHTLADTAKIPETLFTSYSYQDPLRLAPLEEIWGAQATAWAFGLAWDGDAEDL